MPSGAFTTIVVSGPPRNRPASSAIANASRCGLGDAYGSIDRVNALTLLDPRAPLAAPLPEPEPDPHAAASNKPPVAARNPRRVIALSGLPCIWFRPPPPPPAR